MMTDSSTMPDCCCGLATGRAGCARHASSDEQGYNGWSNYETWAVALWIDNEPRSYESSREIVRSTAENFVPLYTEGPEVEVAGALKAWFEPMAPDLGATAFADLLNAALGEVDWYEIAENYLSEISEDA